MLLSIEVIVKKLGSVLECRTGIKKLISILFLSLFSFFASADYFCTGEVQTVGVKRGGVVVVKGPGGLPSVYLCNLSSTVNNVTPEACRAVYSTLLAAEAQGAKVSITFNPNISSCNSLPSWDYARNFNWVLTQ